MAGIVASGVIASFLSIFKERINKGIDISVEELENFFGDGLFNYLERECENHQFLKTFIFRDKAIDFNKIYFPVEFEYDGKKITDKGILSLLKKKKTISIIGSAGSGKTMLVSKLFLEFFKSKEKIPIVIKLRHFNSYSSSFTDFIYEKVLLNKVHPSERILERVLSNGNFIFFLDGYDEIYSKNKQKLTREIDEFINIFSKNNFIITSRPGTSIEHFNKFINLEVLSLSKVQIKKFISLQTKLMQDSLLGDRIIETIKKPENDDYTDYLSSPLLLSMFIYTYNKYPEIPKKKSKFYYHVWKTLCFDHDSINKKEGHIQDRTSGLTTDEIEDIILWFSFIAFMDGQFSFDEDYLVKKLKKIKRELNLNFEVSKVIYDLRTSLSILILDGVEYKFPHKSIQEYFTSYLILSFTDDQKSNLYQNLLPNLIENTEKNSLENFFKICLEIDRVSFYNFFILFHLKQINKELELLNKLEQFKKLTETVTIFMEGEVDKNYTIKNIYLTGNVIIRNTVYTEIFTYLGFYENIFEILKSQVAQNKSFFIHKEEFTYYHSNELDSLFILKIVNQILTQKKGKAKGTQQEISTLKFFKSRGKLSFGWVILPNFNKEIEENLESTGIVNTLTEIKIKIEKKIKEVEDIVSNETNKFQNLIKIQ